MEEIGLTGDRAPRNEIERVADELVLCQQMIDHARGDAERYRHQFNELRADLPAHIQAFGAAAQRELVIWELQALARLPEDQLRAGVWDRLREAEEADLDYTCEECGAYGAREFLRMGRGHNFGCSEGTGKRFEV